MNKPIDYVRSVYADIDTMDVKKLTKHLTDDCNFVFANAEPKVGKPAVEEFIGGFMQAIGGIKHEIDESWRSDDVVVSRLRVTYTRKDGARKTYPAAVIFRMRSELIKDFLIYVDNSTLFQ